MGFIDKLCRRCACIRYTTAKIILIITLNICILYEYSKRYCMDYYINHWVMAIYPRQSDIEGVAPSSIHIVLVTSSTQIAEIIMHPIVGFLSDMYGGALMLKVGFLANVFLCWGYIYVVTTLAWWSVALFTFVFATTTCMVITPVYSLLAHWINKRELTFLSSSIYAGSFCGTFILILAVEYIETQWWSLKVFFFGAVVILLILVFNIFSAPWMHPYLKKVRRSNSDFTTTNAFPQRIPWKMIMKSQGVRSVWFGFIGHRWLFSQLVYGTHFEWASSLKLVSWRTKIVPIAGIIGVLSTGYAFQNIINSKKMPEIYVRIITNLLGILLCTLIATIAMYPINIYLSTILYCVAFFLLGAGFSGSSVNVHDLTRHYSGTIIGIANGIVACIVLFYKLTRPAAFCIDPREREIKKLWMTFFISLACTLLSIIWIHSEQASWDIVYEEEEEEDD